MDRKIIERLTAEGVLITGDHVWIGHERCTSTYFDNKRLLTRPALTAILCGQIAKWFVEQDIQAVVAPKGNAMHLAHQTALQLSELCGKEILSSFISKIRNENELTIRKHYREPIEGKRVLVVDDVIDTDERIGKYLSTVRSRNGIPVGFSTFFRRPETPLLEQSNITLAILFNGRDTWNRGECPHCKARKPLNHAVGKRGDILALAGR